MGKLALLRSLYRSTRLRSSRFSSSINEQQLSHGFHHYITPSSFNLHRSIFSLSPHIVATFPKGASFDCRPPFPIGIGSIRSFCEDVTHLPIIRDSDIEYVFKDLMASSWDELPDGVINDAKKALSKNTKDIAGREALANVFRAAEAVEEFGGILVSLRMEIDDIIGMSGENVRPLPHEHADALCEVYKRYAAYLDAFGSDELYLRKKVETELGTKMIHLKMRCSFLDSEWEKVKIRDA